MRAAVLYDEERLRKNGYFADSVCKCLNRRGAEARLVTVDEVESLDVDVVVRRCEALDEAKTLEARGIKVINNAFVSEICNDKWLTYKFFGDRGIPMCPTFRAEENLPDFPCVVKARCGHGGGQVFLAENKEEYDKVLAQCDNAIVQPFLSCGGEDMRLYVVGGRVMYAVKRSGKDFRSNFSLGGTARKITPDVEMSRMAEEIATLLDADFVGVDIIRADGKYILNEVEDVVGTRMLYALGMCDAADVLAWYTMEKVK